MVCINNKYDSGEIIDGITLVKIYIMSPHSVRPFASPDDAFGYNLRQFIDDNGNLRLWLDDMGLFFMPIDEWREKQLDNILQ